MNTLLLLAKIVVAYLIGSISGALVLGRFRRVGYEVAYFIYRTLMRIFAVGKYT